jgi:hypothetical protein
MVVKNEWSKCTGIIGTVNVSTGNIHVHVASISGLANTVWKLDVIDDKSDWEAACMLVAWTSFELPLVSFVRSY